MMETYLYYSSTRRIERSLTVIYVSIQLAFVKKNYMSKNQKFHTYNNMTFS